MAHSRVADTRINKIDTLFIEACENAQLSQLADLLCLYPEHDVASIRLAGGCTLLHLLAKANSPEAEKEAQTREAQLEVFGPAVALLLCAGLKINSVDNCGMTCLHVAAKCGTGSFIHTLIKRGADPRKLADKSMNVLHFASSNHNTSAWEVLLQSLQDPIFFLKSRNKSGASPSHLCSLDGNANGLAICTKYLSDHQTILQSPSLPRSFRDLPTSSIILTKAILKRTSKELISAICRGMSPDNISQLLNGSLQPSPSNGISSPFTTRSKHSTWLHFCCKYSAESSILALLHFGAISVPDSAGLLPIHYALSRCFPLSCIELSRHMSIELWSHLDKHERSLLHWICTFASPPPYFIKHESSAIPTNVCCTWDPLWYFLASSKPNGSKQTYLEYLTSNRVLSLPDLNGNLPVHLLAQRDITGKALDLLCQKSDPEDVWRSTRDGHNVLHLAARNRSEDALSVLLHHLWRIAEPEPEAATVESVDNNESVSSSNLTPPTAAASATASTPPSVRPNASTAALGLGSRPWQHFQLAGKRGPELVSYLLNQQDPMGRTPLHLAVKTGHVRAVQVLLDANADVSIVDKKGLNCSALAAKYKSLMVLVQLEENGVCTIEQAKLHLSAMGFRSSIPELESMKHDVEQLRLPSAPSSDTVAPKNIVPTLAMAGALSVGNIARSFSPPLDRKASPLHLEPVWPLLPLSYANTSNSSLGPQVNSYNVREGEKFPILGRRTGSAPATTENQFVPGRLSPRGQRSNHSPTVSITSLPSTYSFSPSTSPAQGRRSSLSSSIEGGILASDTSVESFHTTDVGLAGMSDVNSEGSVDSETLLPSIPSGRLRINLERIPSTRSLPSRSSSSSPPRSPAQSNPFSSNWGPPSPTSSPMSPRSISPRSRSGNVTPPGTPTSSGYERMKLQRSLSPRSLPTIKEVNPDAGKEGGDASKEGKEKDVRVSAKRHRSGSNSSLKKALMLRSRSLTKLPTNPGDDFLEAIKPTAPSSYGQGGSYTLHPGTLDAHFNNIIHSRSHSDQTHSGDVSIPPTLPGPTHTVTTTKRRHKSTGKPALQSSDSST